MDVAWRRSRCLCRNRRCSLCRRRRIAFGCRRQGRIVIRIKIIRRLRRILRNVVEERREKDPRRLLPRPQYRQLDLRGNFFNSLFIIYCFENWNIIQMLRYMYYLISSFKQKSLTFSHIILHSISVNFMFLPSSWVSVIKVAKILRGG